MIWLFFMRMSKNSSSFDLCSPVNFILGCRFRSRLCYSLMSPHRHFQNMKQSSEYFFHDLVNFPFMLLPYFLLIISYIFSSKYARVRVVPIAEPRLWM